MIPLTAVLPNRQVFLPEPLCLDLHIEGLKVTGCESKRLTHTVIIIF